MVAAHQIELWSEREAMTHWPRPLDDLDRRLGADPHERDRGLLACFEPRLPAQADVDAALWDALRIRADERAREWNGPIGDTLARPR